MAKAPRQPVTSAYVDDGVSRFTLAGAGREVSSAGGECVVVDGRLIVMLPPSDAYSSAALRPALRVLYFAEVAVVAAIERGAELPDVMVTPGGFPTPATIPAKS